MQLWGATAWALRARGERGCWEGLGGARFFDDALAGTRCVTAARSEPRRSEPWRLARRSLWMLHAQAAARAPQSLCPLGDRGGCA